MSRQSLVFEAPERVSIQREPVPTPGPAQVLVQTALSAISPGSELLIFRGEAPEHGPLDLSIAALGGGFSFPLRYGYACVGEVVALGDGVLPEWLGRRVFVFHPHDSHIVTPVTDLIVLPDWISNEQAAFLPNLETAVNLVMDGRPVVGERVVVCGQGIVGLLTTLLLARFPAECLIAVERSPMRRERARQFGIEHAFDPSAHELHRLLALDSSDEVTTTGADLIYELSGNPEALNAAIGWTGFESRIIVGSWYGRKQAPIDLGERFHRNRVQIISSQVSTIASGFRGRWTKKRRFELVFALLAELPVGQLITHRLSIQQAQKAYEMLRDQPDQALQVLFTYEDRE